MRPDDCFERVRRLCEELEIIREARKSTRFWLTGRVAGGIDDDAVLQRLQVHATRVPCLELPQESLAKVLSEEAQRLLRERLVTRLVEHDDLLGIAGRAAAGAGIPERAQQVACCLVVLCQKHDPARKPAGGVDKVRTFGLDVGEHGFADGLRGWAVALADQLRADAPTYDAIMEEACEFSTHTLGRLIGAAPHEADVADMVSVKLLSTFLRSPTLGEMNLARAVAFGPAGDEYVFQSPIRRWIRTIWNRERPRRTDSLDERQELGDPVGIDGVIAARARDRRATSAWLRDSARELNQTRQALADAVAAVEKFLRAAERDRPSGADVAIHCEAAVDELRFVASELRRERGRFVAMLTYILVAMRIAPKRQAVSILSLRGATLDARVVEQIGRQMRAVLADGAPLAASLIVRTEDAQGVPRKRAAELVRVRDDHRYRRTALAQVRELLDVLPGRVADLAAIGRAVPGTMSASAAGTTRGQASDELTAVDRYFGRAFRRYAMGIT